MGSVQEADLMAIGQHCAAPDCAQLDFLPFRCDCCSQTFCLEHRTYSAHRCPKSGSKQLEVIVCPICARGVHVKGDEDPNVSFDRHIRIEGCDPSNYNKVHKKPKCPVPGCKEKLTSINTYTCKACTQKVCMKHRLESDHKCPGKAAHPLVSGHRPSMAAAAAAAGRSLSSKASTLFIDLTGGSRSPSPAATTAASRGPVAVQQQQQASRPRQQQQQQQQQDPSNTLYGSADRRRQQLGLPPRQQQQQASAASQGSEQCPQCSSRFATVQDLIAHVETAHSSNSSSHSSRAATPPAAAAAAANGSSAGEVFPCPTCGTRFHDAVALVAHSQQCRPRRQQQQQQQSQQQQCVMQ